MKQLLISISLLLTAITADAIIPPRDTIYIDGNKWTLFKRPLEQNSKILNSIVSVLPKHRHSSNDNRYGYTATWSINDNNLVLDNITYYIIGKNGRPTYHTLSEEKLKSAFIKAGLTPFVASWYTDSLIAAKGFQRLCHPKDNYNYYVSWFPVEMHCNIKNGIVVHKDLFYNKMIIDENKAIIGSDNFPINISNYPFLIDDQAVISVNPINLDIKFLLLPKCSERQKQSLIQDIKDRIISNAKDTIPFLHYGHLYLDAAVNDSIQCRVIFDTGGADMFGIDSVFLAHSTWKPKHISTAIAGGGSGTTKVQVISEPARVKSFNYYEDFDFVPIFKLRDVLGCHVDGIIGIKDIMLHPLEINFEHCYIKQHIDDIPDIEGYMKVPITYKDKRILLQAETMIAGKSIKGTYLMDTGGGGTIDFTAATTRQNSLETIEGKRIVTDYTQFGLGDKEQETIVTMKSQLFIIGNDTITNEEIDYLPNGAWAFSDREYLGTIGNNIWSKYNIIIDANAGFMYLKRFKPSKEYSESYGYNFRNRTDIGKGWIVSSLEREGAAAIAGLQLNDIILSINGKDVEDYTWEEEREIDDLPSQDLEIKDKDGKIKNIHIEPQDPWK